MNDSSEIGTTIATYVYEVRLPPPVRFEHDPADRSGRDGRGLPRPPGPVSPRRARPRDRRDPGGDQRRPSRMCLALPRGAGGSVIGGCRVGQAFQPMWVPADG